MTNNLHLKSVRGGELLSTCEHIHGRFTGINIHVRSYLLSLWPWLPGPSTLNTAFPLSFSNLIGAGVDGFGEVISTCAHISCRFGRGWEGHLHSIQHFHCHFLTMLARRLGLVY
jgi:hypothetical protein